jgi:tetratricopeptide (TPR) repeat protein
MIRSISSVLSTIVLLCSFAAANPTPRELIVAGRIDDAIATLRTRLTANPQDAEAYHLLSRAYYSVQRWDDAISNGERAVSLKPADSDYHMWLGRAYGEKASASNFLTAIELAKKVRAQFETAVQLNGNNFAARADLSEFYVDAPGFLGGGKDKARIQADQIISLEPATAHWIRSIVAQKEKKFDVAEQELLAAVHTSKDPGSRWMDLAAFYRERSQLKQMENAINNGLSVPNRPAPVLYDAADILIRAGRNFDGAAEMLRSYMNSGDPGDDAPLFQAHYLLGTLLEKMGDRAGAAAQYRAALALARDFQKAQDALKRLQ